jgi:Protein of unknown function (DUF1570)
MGTAIEDKGVRPISFLTIGRSLFLLVFLALAVGPSLSPHAAAQVQRPQPAGMQTYPSPYYIVHSDLDLDRTNEAILRMTRMAEEYHERTKEFSGVIRTKFPFFLFKNEEDYYAAGAPPGSAGVFMVDGNGARLMAIAGDETKRFTWHVVQHEGFHQFAHAVIGGELPPWLNEGLAEYFGEGLFTGDGFVTGLLPPHRVRDIQAEINNKAFRSMENMMLMTQDGWNGRLLHTNYDMAWSMAHFLAHGDNGKYQAAFAGFVKDIGRQVNWQRAWQARFGSAEGFEKQWSAWWLGLDPDTASKQLYLKATVEMLTSILGRATMEKQTFDNWEEFSSAIKAQTVKIPKVDWLPPSLLTSAAELAERAGSGIKFEIGHDRQAPQITAVLEDGSKLVGVFNPRIKAGPGRVTITIDDMAVQLTKVKALLEEGKKPEARAILQDAMKRNPKSELIAEARKLLPQTLK